MTSPPARSRYYRPALPERLAFLVLCFMLAFAPLPLASNRPAGWTFLTLLAGIALALWALAAFASRGKNRPAADILDLWPLGLLLLLLAWFVLQAAPWTPAGWHHPLWQDAAATLGRALAGAISADRQATIDGVLRLAGYGAVFFLAMQFAGSRRHRHRLLHVVAWSGTAYALYGLVVEFAGFDSILWYSRWAYHDSLTATFVNRNSFATYAGMTLVVLVVLTWHAVFRARREADSGYGATLDRLAGRSWPLVVAIILVTMALLLSHSRAGLLATLIGLAALAVPRRSGSRRSRSRSLALLPLAGLLAIVALIGGNETWQRLQVEGASSTDNRLGIYREVVRGIAERPLVGHGLDSFATVFPAYRSQPMITAAVIDKAHNSYLEFAFEAGLPALLLAFCGMLTVVWRCARHTAPQGATATRVALAASLLVGSHALLDFSLQIPAVAVLYAALLGLGYGAAVQLPTTRA